MSDIAETYERNGCTVNIYYDTDPESPRDWDNVGTMICSHRNYNLGDEQFDPSDFEGWADLEKHLMLERKAVIILPLFLYDHSGITMYTTGDTRYRQHEAWDSGQVGFIYCTQEDVEREWGVGQDERAIEYLKGEVKTYDQYLRGDVYGFDVTDKNGEDVDSCWGFYGEEYAKEEANAAADNHKPFRDAKYAKNATVVHG